MPKKATPKKAAKKNGSGHHYDASSIAVLEGLDPVRKRPGMYIGTTGPDGLHHLIWEVFDNSRDEAMGGFADRVEVTLLPDNYVRVVDNGRGIPYDQHERIFEVFQSLGARNDGRAGTGIGLAIVKKIAEIHGGRVWVESEPGRGSAFHVHLPRR